MGCRRFSRALTDTSDTGHGRGRDLLSAVEAFRPRPRFGRPAVAPSEVERPPPYWTRSTRHDHQTWNPFFRGAIACGVQRRAPPTRGAPVELPGRPRRPRQTSGSPARLPRLRCAGGCPAVREATHGCLRGDPSACADAAPPPHLDRVPGRGPRAVCRMGVAQRIRGATRGGESGRRRVPTDGD